MSLFDTFRQHVPPHERSISEQTLDALLRIEELLVILAHAAAAPPAPANTPRPIKDAPIGKSRRL